MKFDAKYPDATNAQKLNPDKLLGPHKEIAVSPTITQSWRVYSCFVCRAPTSWRFESAPACSEECVEQMKAETSESEPEESEPVPPEALVTESDQAA